MGAGGGLGALPEPLDVFLRHPDEEHDGVDPGLDQVSGAADPGLQQAVLVLQYGGQGSAAPQPLRAAGWQGQGREPRVSPRPQLPQGATRGEARPLRDKPPPAWTPGCVCYAPAGPGPEVHRGWGWGVNDFQCKNQSQLQEHLLLPSAHGGILGTKQGQKTPERRAGAGRPWEYCRGFSGRVPWHPWAPRFWRTNLCFAESVTSEANKPPDARALCVELEHGSRKQRTCL